MLCVNCGTELPAGAKFCFNCGAQQAAVASSGEPAQPQSARRVTSVLFGDLVGFTTISEQRDPEEVRELLSRYFDGCRAVVARYGGVIEKFIGDAVMAVWGVPTAHEDDAERAVRAGFELTESVHQLGLDIDIEGLALRVGIVTGEVAVTVGATNQGMVAGDSVNTAARVQSAAEPGHVWVDDLTRELARGAIDFDDKGDHVLKGKAEPMHLWSAAAIKSDAEQGLTDGLSATMFGRDDEMTLITDVFTRVVRDREPAMVLITGEAGLGKSRLASEFEHYVETLPDVVLWHSARCPAYGDSLSYFALAEAVRTRLHLIEGGLGALVPDQEERAWIKPRVEALLGIGESAPFPRDDLFQAWTTLLRRFSADGTPIAIVVDDAQYADDGLMDFLDYVLGSNDLPLLVLMLARPEILARCEDIVENERVDTAHLSGLGTEVMSSIVSELVVDLPEHVRDALVERAAGVPLFAVETVRSLMDRGVVVERDGRHALAQGATVDLAEIGTSASLQALVASRLDTLPTNRRAVVDAASLLGAEFELSILRGLVGEGYDVDTVVRDLVGAQILMKVDTRRGDDLDTYAFVQPMVQQVAYQMLSKRDRRKAHLSVAERFAGGEPRLVAHHLVEAIAAMPHEKDVPELRARALGTLEAAAHLARDLGAHSEAAAWWGRACEVSEERATQDGYLIERAADLCSAGRYADARGDAERALVTFEELTDEVQAGRAAGVLAHALTRGFGLAEEARSVAELKWYALQDNPDADLAMLELSRAMFFAEHMSGGSNALQYAIERARRGGRVGDRSEYAAGVEGIAVSMQLEYGLLEAATALRQLVSDIGRDFHLPGALSTSLANLASTEMLVDIGSANIYANEAAEVESLANLPLSEQGGDMSRAVSSLLMCDWDTVLEAAGPRLGGDYSLEPALFEWCFNYIALARGEEPVERWLPGREHESDDDSTNGWEELGGAQILRARGDIAGAGAAALSGLEKLYEMGGLGDDVPVLVGDVMEYVLAASDVEGLRRLLEMFPAPGASLSVSPALLATRHRLIAWLAPHDDLDPATVERHLRAAVDAYDRWGAPLYAAHTRLELVRLLLAKGEIAEAEELRERTRELFEHLGARAWLSQLVSV